MGVKYTLLGFFYFDFFNPIGLSESAVILVALAKEFGEMLHRSPRNAEQDANHLMEQVKRRVTKIRPKAVGSVIFGRLRTPINADRKKLVTSYPVWL